tara:strand:- start:711 stop:893 length:183 start_codon:yes stop_codon:yes gene_type:complete
MKTYTIATLIINVISLIFIFTFIESDLEAAAGWGVIGTVFTSIYFVVLLSGRHLDAKANQ